MKQALFFIVFLQCSLAHAQQPVGQLRLAAKRITNVKDSYPMPSPDGAKVVFQSDRMGNREIYVMDTSGENLRRLTNNNARDETPVWSPDGSRILFSSDRDDKDGEIYVMNADGSDQKRLTIQAGNDGHAKWSPDGTRIIFNSARTTSDLKAAWPQQVHEVFTMKADGTDVHQLTKLKTISTYPSYSPDGGKILFRSGTQTPAMSWDMSLSQRNSELFVINSDGSNPVNITNNAAYDGWGAWSPDGTKILFSSNRSGPASIGQLFIVNPDGTNPVQITFGPGSFVQPSWSRDGKKIYAHQHWETDEFSNLVVFDYPNS